MNSSEPATAAERQFFGHPRGLSVLFFTELWERFSFYGMRALLILFMTAPLNAGGLGFDVAKAGVIYGAYTALVYLACLPGGWLADRCLGQRSATRYGACIIILGHLNLALPSLVNFYAGLGCVIIGTGLLKPNISALVGQLYAADDVRRDAGFSIYYMGINIGAFFAPLVCGWLAQSATFRVWLKAAGIAPESAWHFGFGMAAVGMAIGLFQFMLGQHTLRDAGLRPAGSRWNTQQLLRAIMLALVLCALATLVVYFDLIAVSAARLGDLIGILLVGVSIVFFGRLFRSTEWTPVERRNLMVMLVLFAGATVFWSLFEQGGSTLNLFAAQKVDTHVFGYAFPSSWLLSLNALFIIGLAPVFAWLWVRLGTRNPSGPAKFTLGLVLVALGFGVLIYAAIEAETGVKVSPWWLVATYFLHTLGELCLSPVGLSAMTRLAPARIAGLAMGVWFLATSIGSYLGGRVASVYETFTLPQLFAAVTGFALVAAVIMGLLIKPLRRVLAE